MCNLYGIASYFYICYDVILPVMMSPVCMFCACLLVKENVNTELRFVMNRIGVKEIKIGTEMLYSQYIHAVCTHVYVYVEIIN